MKRCATFCQIQTAGAPYESPSGLEETKRRLLSAEQAQNRVRCGVGLCQGGDAGLLQHLGFGKVGRFHRQVSGRDVATVAPHSRASVAVRAAERSGY